jgi:hypothetical protein
MEPTPGGSLPDVSVDAPVAVAASEPATRAVVAAVAGLVAAWLAAGAMGLLAHPLRHAMTWLAMAVVMLACWPMGRRSWKERGILAAGVVGGLILTMPATAAYNVLGVAMVLAVLARTQAGLDRRAMTMAAFAATALGVFRLACTTIPIVWLAADKLGQAMGAAASAVSGKPLWIGASLAGVDFLVLMLAFWGVWLAGTARPRRFRAICGLATILVGHLGYLVLIAYAIDLADALPVHMTPEPERYAPPPWFLSDALRTLLPWNLPIVAGLVQAIIAACMLRWATWKAESGGEKVESGKRKAEQEERKAEVESASLSAFSFQLSRFRFPLSAFSFVLAALIPLATVLAPVPCDLAGRKIVVYDRGDLDWQKPVHDKYGRDAEGVYGMFPMLVNCLGGTLARSADLADADLADADVLVVIHPLGPWPDGRVDRVWDYVRRGGSLLVVAEPWLREENQTSSFGELLTPTSMKVRFDTTVGETSLWQDSLHVLAHPATTLLGDDRGRLGLGDCASIDARWPARPLVVGRWGWSDPGSDAMLTRQSQMQSGQRLGDLVLAAEERIGGGTAIVVGDAAAFKNEGLSNGYEFAGRLLGYLAAHGASSQAGWRQALGLLACLALVGLLAWRLEAATMAWASLVLAVSLGGFTLIDAENSKVLPDGRVATPNCLACIDAAHLDAFGGYPWLDVGLHGEPMPVSKDDPRRNGIGGLEMHLMRNGYLPIRLAEVTAEQLQRTGLLVSIAPSRAYSEVEQIAIKQFLDDGGIWVCMAGADRCGPINDALSAYKLSVLPTQLGAVGAEVELPAIDRVALRYLRMDDYDAYAVFDSAWPVRSGNEASEVLIEGPERPPVGVTLAVGKGRIILIGDRFFAANRNLESEEGTIVQQVRENAAFWRWLFARFRDKQTWTPPNIPLPKPGEEDEDDSGNAADAEASAGKLPSGKAPAAKGPSPKGPAENAAAEKSATEKSTTEKSPPGKAAGGKTPAGKGLGASRLLGSRPKTTPDKSTPDKSKDDDKSKDNDKSKAKGVDGDSGVDKVKGKDDNKAKGKEATP